MITPNTTFDPRSQAKAILQAITRQPAGSVYAFREGPPKGYIVSISNQTTDCGIEQALDRVQKLANLLALTNPAIRKLIVIGWWPDENQTLYLDLSLALPNFTQSFHVARAFKQRAIAHVTDLDVSCIPVGDRADPREASPSTLLPNAPACARSFSHREGASS